MPPANPLAQLQQQIESADDMQLRQALAQPMEQVPQIMLMMEMSHRQNQRMAFRQQPPAQSIRDEMLSGRYNPVPPVGIAALQNSLPVQTPQGQYTPQGIQQIMPQGGGMPGQQQQLPQLPKI